MTREVKVRPKYSEVEYQEKLDHLIRFISKGDEVKVTVMLRGREITHPELGERLLLKFAEDLKDLIKPGSSPVREGRQVVINFTPK